MEHERRLSPHEKWQQRPEQMGANEQQNIPGRFQGEAPLRNKWMASDTNSERGLHRSCRLLFLKISIAICVMQYH
jgi:hypothetical protein